MSFKDVTKEEFLLFVENYKPNLSYGECKTGNFPVINYIDTSRGGKNWQDWLVGKIENQPGNTRYLIKTC